MIVVESLVSVLIVLFSIIVLISIIYVIAPKGTEKVNETACAASVGYRSQSSVEVSKVGKFSGGPLLCRTQVTELGKEKKTMVSKIIPKKDTLASTLERSNVQLAENIKNCWKMMGQGKYPFSSDKVILGSELQCFTCYDVAYPASIKSPVNSIKYQDEYLNGKYAVMPKKKDKSDGVKYMDYITKSGGCGYLIMPQELNPGERYGIVFVGNLQGFYGEWMGIGLLAAGAIAVPGVKTAASFTARGFFALGSRLLAAVGGGSLAVGTVAVAATGYGLKRLYDSSTYNAVESDLDNALKEPDATERAKLVRGVIEKKQKDFKEKCQGIWILPTNTIPEKCYIKPVRV